MNNTIAVLIPTFGRVDRWEKLVENIRSTAEGRPEIYFIVENFEVNTVMEELANRIGAHIILNSGGTYVSAINTGYRCTSEEFVFCGSDDIEFTPKWDTIMVNEFQNPDIGMVGSRDEWIISKTGLHASHFMIRRSYILTASGVEDERNVIYSSKYHHLMCDIETEQTAMKRGAFKLSDAVVHHHHWFMGDAQKDATYERASQVQAHDEGIYNSRRKRFELYYFEELFSGNIVPVNKKKLSVVVASYNQLNYLKMTLESLYENTYHPFELILIDDCSSDQATRNFIKSYPKACIKRLLDHHIYTDGVWNMGMELSSGDCVAILNNDITFSKNWDIHLMNDLENPDIWLASPYQSDPEVHEAYGKHERAGGLDIRGSGFMLKREAIQAMGKIPKELVMWFGDWWIAREVTDVFKKRAVFNPKSVIHHYCSKSSDDLNEKTGLLNWILRGDAYAFHEMTGIDVTHWLDVVHGRLGI